MVLPRKTMVGRRFFKADELKVGTEAVVSAKPYWEDVRQTDGSLQQRFRVPARYNDEEGFWSPGVTAYDILLHELGDDEEEWPGKTIVFAIEEVKTKQGVRYAKVAHLRRPSTGEEQPQRQETQAKASCVCPFCKQDFGSWKDLVEHVGSGSH